MSEVFFFFEKLGCISVDTPRMNSTIFFLGKREQKKRRKCKYPFKDYSTQGQDKKKKVKLAVHKTPLGRRALILYGLSKLFFKK